jgi:hypothetical protein
LLIKIAVYLNEKDLSKLFLHSSNAQLYYECFRSQKFWYRLYTYAFGLTGFAVHQLDWRKSYLKKIAKSGDKK